MEINNSNPELTTMAPTNITDTSATLNAEINPNNSSPKVSFIYYLANHSEQSQSLDAIPNQVSGNNWVKVSADIKGLSVGTTYYFYVSALFTNGQTVSFATNYLPDQLFEGGIKFYVDSTGQHGLIAAPNDQSIGIEWANNGVTKITGAEGTAVGTGLSNTTTIILAQGLGSYAASICKNLSLNGYNDWFLPSRDELNLLYENRKIVGGLNSMVNYWSSSESSSSNAWAQGFSSGNQVSNSFKLKNFFNVRAVRKF